MRLPTKEEHAQALALATLEFTQQWAERVADDPQSVNWLAMRLDLAEAIRPELQTMYIESAMQLAAEAGVEINADAMLIESGQWSEMRAEAIAAGVVENRRAVAMEVHRVEENKQAAALYLLLLMGWDDFGSEAITADGGSGIVVGGEVLPWPVDASGNRIDNAWQTAGGYRATLIGVTETSEASAAGGRGAARRIEREHSITLVGYWHHHEHRPPGHCGAAIDPCKICTPLEGHPIKEVGFFPPAHPGCDCDVDWAPLGGGPSRN